METRFQLHAADAVRENGFGVRVHDAVDAGVLFQYLAVDAAFSVPFRHALLDGRGIFDVVFDNVGGGRD